MLERLITCLLLFFIFFVSCKEKKADKGEAFRNTKNQFIESPVICDTCITTIIVHHDDCTFCGEITVDSGVVFIPSKILRINDTLIDYSNIEDSSYVPHHQISLKGLTIGKEAFLNLWKDTMNGSDLYKTFRLTGKIIDLKRRVLDNGVIEPYPTLVFKIEELG
jgi:hypothetical protein